MEQRKDLKLKYLTGIYAHMDGLDKNTDNMYTLINEIKSGKRSKKNWSVDDFIFGEEIAKHAFGEDSNEVIESLVESGYVTTNQAENISAVYSITNEGLRLFFIF